MTLFEDRAEVVRSARVFLEPGSHWVALGGVSPFVDDRSVQARAPDAALNSAFVVLGARVVRRLHHAPSADRAELEALEAEQRAAKTDVERAGLAYERAELAATRVEQLAARWAEQLQLVPRRIGRPKAGDRWRESWQTLRSAQEKHAHAADDAESALISARDAADRAAERLAAGRVEQSRWEAVIEVQVLAESATEGELEATYRVPCALWRPEHLARLVRSGDESDRAGTVELATFATAWQATGERWEDVEMRFSTARPARVSTPPPVTDDVLATRKKTEQSKRETIIEQHEQAVSMAGLERGARQVDEMPGVDDGGAPRVYAAVGPVTLPSDGRPLRIEVASWTAKADVARVLVPELALASHLRATLTNPGPEPVLAGPVRLVRAGSLVGRARVGYVGAGEPFELGFGLDDGVRVRRDVTTERDTTLITSAQRVRRTVMLYVSNLSGEARSVLVRERVPVSEIDAVQVVLGELHDWKHDPRDGFVSLALQLPARGTKTLQFSYEVRAGAKVRLPF